MISLATADVELDAPVFTKAQLRQHAIRLFDEWDAQLGDGLPFDDYALELLLEEGSLKAKGRLLTTLTLTVLAIEHFGSFPTGVRELSKLMRNPSGYFVQLVTDSIPHTEVRSSHRGTGELGRIENLLKRVRRGELTPDQAADKAREILSKDPDASPQLIGMIEQAMREVRRNPEQLKLFDDALMPDIPAPPKQPTERKKPPKELPLPAEAYRVLITRDSKNGKKKVKVEEL